MTVRQRKTARPWELRTEDIPPSVVFAVKALAAGAATEQQQLMLWKYIREDLCGIRRMSFWPGGEDGRRATDFADGKRFVAITLERLNNLQPAKVDIRDDPPPMPRDAQPGED